MSVPREPTRPLTGSTVDTRRAARDLIGGFLTPEFIVYVIIVLAVIITSSVVDGATVTNSDGSHTTGPDPFDATQAMQYIVFLTIGYLIATGLARTNRNTHRDI
ncbi:hypothetical protein [Subtercola frigoramans]|uniref:Uncharacterized protein n=1 Tax=Subtercola frigoramans TaxID=120298 RepID=A0ABS2L0Q1_9MICO|nr:hypothetical protein [Subtercola frigoramans]MBM7470619.1 hypothetical protein [Subtercola frigoramans]